MQTGVQAQKLPDEARTQKLLVLYQSTNDYILQYRDFAFRIAVYSIGLLGACIGLGLNERFWSMWSPQTRGFLLAVLLVFGIGAVVFICVVNQKCILLKQRRTALEELLGYNKTGLSANGAQPLIAKAHTGVFARDWRYALAFCGLIAVVTVLAVIAFWH